MIMRNVYNYVIVLFFFKSILFAMQGESNEVLKMRL